MLRSRFFWIALLIAVPPDHLDDLLMELRQAGVETASVIGEIADGPGRIHVQP